MLIGHYAPALLIHRARPSAPLWALMVAVQFVDILWGLFILTGVEHVRLTPGFTASNDLELFDMPYSHSVVATLGWTLAVFLAWRLFAKRPARTAGPARTVDAIVLAAAVASHFLLDLLVHVQDLPLAAAQGTKLGLGLWNDKALALTVETLLFAGSALVWWWPRRATAGARGAATWLAIMTVVCATFFFMPAPPTPTLLALSGLALYVAVPFAAAWAERRTQPRAAASAPVRGPTTRDSSP